MVRSSDSRVHTLRSRTTRLIVLSAPLMTLWHHHVSITPTRIFWAEALATATYLINSRTCKAINSLVPYMRLHGSPPTYATLRVFGCLCYPNVASTSPHKVSPVPYHASSKDTHPNTMVIAATTRSPAEY
jgi:hypothetical protein